MSDIRKEVHASLAEGDWKKVLRLDDICLTRAHHHRSLLPFRRLEPLVEVLQGRSNTHP